MVTRQRRVRGFWRRVPAGTLGSLREKVASSRSKEWVRELPAWLAGIGNFGLCALAIWVAFWSPLPEALETQLRQQVTSLERDRNSLQDDIAALEFTRSDVGDQISMLEAAHETAMTRAVEEITTARQERDDLRGEIAALTSASDTAWEAAVRVYAYSWLSDSRPWNYSGMMTHNPGRLERVVRAWRENDESEDDFEDVQEVLRIVGMMWDNMRDAVVWEVDPEQYASPLEADLAVRAQSVLRDRFDTHCPSRSQWTHSVLDAIEVRAGIQSARIANRPIRSGNNQEDIVAVGNSITREDPIDVDSTSSASGLVDARDVLASDGGLDVAELRDSGRLVDVGDLLWTISPNEDFVTWVEEVAWSCFLGGGLEVSYRHFRLEDWIASFDADAAPH